MIYLVHQCRFNLTTSTQDVDRKSICDMQSLYFSTGLAHGAQFRHNSIKPDNGGNPAFEYRLMFEKGRMPFNTVHGLVFRKSPIQHTRCHTLAAAGSGQYDIFII